MPRGHKSRRHHPPKKHPQARVDSQGGEDAQEEVPSTTEAVSAVTEVEQGAAATAIGEEQEEVEESTFFQDPPGAAYWSPPLTRRVRSPSTSGFSDEGSVVSSEKFSIYEYEQSTSGANFWTESLSHKTRSPIKMLAWFILRKFDLKELFTMEEVEKAVQPAFRDEFPEIFKSACEHLEAIFAVEVTEVETKHHYYDLISKLNLPNNGRVRPGMGYPKTGLLMKVLSVILMKNNCASEEDIWKFLKKMKVYPGKKHTVFGQTKKLLTQSFVSLKYLEYRRVPGSVPPCHEFLWGPQAHAEISKEKIMKFLSTMKKVSPNAFSYLYDDILKDKVEKIQAALAACSVTTPDPSSVVQVTCPAPLPKLEDA
ncbi:melanoma-associated antigen B5-like [Octodon degus]|uniref:Melanoma-associated antigen B5-like n=1 Tax=Octodon degus TaxID=10160 RepID=A0A6P3F6G4_OCTDE|nr:melanoma-associated antigen B5-like [Octodon degus]